MFAPLAKTPQGPIGRPGAPPDVRYRRGRRQEVSQRFRLIFIFEILDLRIEDPVMPERLCFMPIEKIIVLEDDVIIRKS